jgi:hypothetical protein
MKMTNLIKMAALGLSAFATVAAANPSGGAAAGSSAATSSAAVARGSQATDKKKYCVNLEAISGSRMGKRACKTKAEWAEEGVQVGVKK